jgi:SagB-type dehydrogenase family enzyme
LRASRTKPGRQSAAPVISARLNERVTLETRADGSIAACFDGYMVELGKFSAGAAKRAQALHAGLPISKITSARSRIDKEIAQLARGLARRGLLEYRLAPARGGKDLLVVEPQVADYWPQPTRLRAVDTVVLSRFAYLRRRGGNIVLESPIATALFRICDPAIASTIALLSTPHRVGNLRRERGFAGLTLPGLLFDCRILFKVGPKVDNLRSAEGEPKLVVWDFHDLVFHTHSTEGRQANPLGGRYPFLGEIPPPPAVRPGWSGDKIDLRIFAAEPATTTSALATLLDQRRSTRDFDDERRIGVAELALLLERTARVRTKWTSALDFGNGTFGPEIDYTSRPYPSAGSGYELELYLAVANCKGLERGFYHYDADRHALMRISVREQQLHALLEGASYAMGAPAPPQILITLAARFDRICWKYSGIAYSLILKDVGVVLQTLYLAATDLGLAGCAIGTGNIDLFAKITGQEIYAEGPVGQFALGRAAESAQ